MTVIGHLTGLCPPLLTPTDELMVTGVEKSARNL